MYHCVRLIICLLAVIVHNAAYATKLSHKEYERFSGLASQTNSNELLRVRDKGGIPYIKIVRGLLDSDKGNIGQYIQQIPCNIISTLESDASAAETFVQQIQEGQVPSIITNLPQEAVDAFKDVVNIFASLPTEIIDVGEAAVTDVVHIVDDIEDGSITSVLAALPSEIVAGITEGWDDLTNGLTDAWNGLTNGFDCAVLDKCPTTPVQTCGPPPSAAASTTPVNASAPQTNSAAAAYSSSAYITSNASLASASSASHISAVNASTASQQPSIQSVVQTPTASSSQSTPQSPTKPSLASRNFEWAVGSLLGIAVVGILGIAVLL